MKRITILVILLIVSSVTFAQQKSELLKFLDKHTQEWNKVNKQSSENNIQLYKDLNMINDNNVIMLNSGTINFQNSKVVKQESLYYPYTPTEIIRLDGFKLELELDKEWNINQPLHKSESFMRLSNTQ